MSSGRPFAARRAAAAVAWLLPISTFVAGIATACGAGTSAPRPAAAPADEAAEYTLPKPRPVDLELEVTDRVEIGTSMGTIVAGLYGEDAPNTVRNFLSYVDRGFYSGTIFHRVIRGFMIQGGGFDAGLARAATDPPIRLEIIPGLRHEAGTLSMARTPDPNSATSQFFICVAPAPLLNGSYAAFGRVEEGSMVALDISTVPTQTQDGPNGEMGDVPVKPVFIQYVKRLEAPAAATTAETAPGK